MRHGDETLLHPRTGRLEGRYGCREGAKPRRTVRVLSTRAHACTSTGPRDSNLGGPDDEQGAGRFAALRASRRGARRSQPQPHQRPLELVVVQPSSGEVPDAELWKLSEPGVTLAVRYCPDASSELTSAHARVGDEGARDAVSGDRRVDRAAVARGARLNRRSRD